MFPAVKFPVASLLFGSLVALAAGDEAGTRKPPAQPAAKQKDFHPLYASDGVQKSLVRAVAFLRKQQRDDGGWEVNLPGGGIEGGWSALALWSLLNAGVGVDDATVARGLKYLRELRPTFTYVRALQLMVFVKAGQMQDHKRIGENVKWLLDARIVRAGKLHGWSYSTNGVAGDNSNTHFAVMALHEAALAGTMIDPRIWREIQEYCRTTQLPDGGWAYTQTPHGGTGATLTMTSAGISGLCVTSRHLNNPRDTAKALEKAWKELHTNFNIELPQRTFYSLHALARAGRLSGMRLVPGKEKRDWYEEGTRYLLRTQRADGAWSAGGAWDQWPVVSTSLALLFLAYGK